MADVFLSYANEDREIAEKLANLLEKRGWSVWWDRRIVVGAVFDEVIERELEEAKSVIVLWSKHSIKSEWVKNEAAVASERGVLVPARIENIPPPLEFRRKQTVDLIEWTGEHQLDEFEKLCHGLAFLTAKEAAPLEFATCEAAPRFRWKQLLLTVGVVIVSILATVFVMNQKLQVSITETSVPSSLTKAQSIPKEQGDLIPPRQRAEGKEIEPNNNYDQANQISAGDSISGFFNDASPDWIAVKVDPNEAFLYIKIRNLGGQFCGVRFFSAEEEELIFETFPYGKHSAKVYPTPINGTIGIFIFLFATQVNGSCSYEIFTSYSQL